MNKKRSQPHRTRLGWDDLPDVSGSWILCQLSVTTVFGGLGELRWGLSEWRQGRGQRAADEHKIAADTPFLGTRSGPPSRTPCLYLPPDLTSIHIHCVFSNRNHVFTTLLLGNLNIKYNYYPRHTMPRSSNIKISNDVCIHNSVSQILAMTMWADGGS